MQKLIMQKWLQSLALRQSLQTSKTRLCILPIQQRYLTASSFQINNSNNTASKESQSMQNCDKIYTSDLQTVLETLAQNTRPQNQEIDEQNVAKCLDRIEMLIAKDQNLALTKLCQIIDHTTWIQPPKEKQVQQDAVSQADNLGDDYIENLFKRNLSFLPSSFNLPESQAASKVLKIASQLSQNTLQRLRQVKAPEIPQKVPQKDPLQEKIQKLHSQIFSLIEQRLFSEIKEGTVSPDATFEILIGYLSSKMGSQVFMLTLIDQLGKAFLIHEFTAWQVDRLLNQLPPSHSIWQDQSSGSDQDQAVLYLKQTFYSSLIGKSLDQTFTRDSKQFLGFAQGVLTCGPKYVKADHINLLLNDFVRRLEPQELTYDMVVAVFEFVHKFSLGTPESEQLIDHQALLSLTLETFFVPCLQKNDPAVNAHQLACLYWLVANMGYLWEKNVLEKMENQLCSILTQEVLRLKLAQNGQKVGESEVDQDDLDTIMALYDLSSNLKQASRQMRQIKRLSKELNQLMPQKAANQQWFYI